ncbi:hypothetical protein [Ralstonia pseudosolanacearum]
MQNYIKSIFSLSGAQLIGDLNSFLEPLNEHPVLAWIKVANDLASLVPPALDSLVPTLAEVTNLISGVTGAIDISHEGTSPEGRVGDTFNIIDSV